MVFINSCLCYILSMKIVKDEIFLDELKTMSKNMFGNLVKAVVDIEKKIMAVNAELHSDEEQILLENGSTQNNLWGINLYPEKFGTDNFVEFDSMINLRPSQNNRTRGVDDPRVQDLIKNIVDKLTINE